MIRAALIGAVVLAGLWACSTVSTVQPPSQASTRPVDYPGLPNVVAYAPGIYAGAAPEGEQGFATLERMGIKTILTVDGTKPDVAAARTHAMRYVHLPIGYDGMDPERTAQIARAVRDLPGPIYIHCHHGQHRGPAAAAAACVALGRLTRAQAIEKMHESGTSPSYPGLFAAVAEAVPNDPRVDQASTDFPEISRTSGLVDAMVAIDSAFDHLKLLHKSNWAVPQDHPDLVPAAEAGQLADLFRNLKDDEQVLAHPDDFQQQMHAAAQAASRLEAALVNRQPADAAFKAVAQSCATCHTQYRN